MMIAEESTAWPAVTQPPYLGGLGFLFKWNMGWMHDVLGYMSSDPIFRKYNHNMITFALLYAFQENFMLVLSHDEVVHGKGSLLKKMPGDAWQKFANVRALYGFMLGHPGKKLLFMGAEFGQWNEWDCDHSLDWKLLDDDLHRGLQRFVRDVNQVYTSEPALFRDDLGDQSFAWIDCHDSDNSVISFLRNSPEETVPPLVFVGNFTPLPRHGYRIGVPFPGEYREVINSDWTKYGGSGVGNDGGCHAESTPWQGQPYSLCLTLPPLGILMLKLRGTEAGQEDEINM
jgi:1,4-alpha-glucan branching enzyme